VPVVPQNAILEVLWSRTAILLVVSTKSRQARHKRGFTMTNEQIARELVATARILASAGRERKAAITHTVPFRTYAGGLSNYRELEREVKKEVADYNVNDSVSNLILDVLRRKAGDIEKGRKVTIDFQIPIFAERIDDQTLELQFQT
jgi:hypothetical protein